MNIITISRQFGSNGKQLAKYLASYLNYDYYDKDIIKYLAKSNNFDEEYVDAILNSKGWQVVPKTFRSSLTLPLGDKVGLLLDEQNIIKEIAKKGRNCIIVGRSADEVLKDLHPFSIFVCAPLHTRVQRCLEHAKDDISYKEMEKMVKRVDTGRARTREIVSNRPWGASDSYNMVINTEGMDIEKLAKAVGNFALAYFNDQQ